MFSEYTLEQQVGFGVKISAHSGVALKKLVKNHKTYLTTFNGETRHAAAACHRSTSLSYSPPKSMVAVVPLRAAGCATA
ncbi:MAG: hypothetical protein IKR25_08985, partial [Muribaculaceae bacterium]|nr:hypothetical protein [Muribaculaceae bacterium]